GDEVSPAFFKPSRSLPPPLARIVPLDIGDPIHCFQAGQVVFLKHHPTRSKRRYNGFDVGNLPRHLGVIARGGSRGLEQGEVAATAPVTKASWPLLDGLQPEFLRIESPSPIEISNWKASCDLRHCQHCVKPPLVDNLIESCSALPSSVPLVRRKFRVAN